MSKITKIDRTFIRLARPEIESALADFCTKYGLSVSVGKGKFSDSNVTLHVEFAVQNAAGVVVTKEVEAFNRYHAMFGLKATDLHREFGYRGNTYKLMGLNPKARRNPLIVERQPDGKTFIMPVEFFPRGE